MGIYQINTNNLQTLYFKCKSFDDYTDWISVLYYFHSHPITTNKTDSNNIEYDGIIEKKGGVLGGKYQKRYFVLRNNHIWYSKPEDKLLPSKYNKIDLNDVQQITVIDTNDPSYYKFHIIQSKRTWHLRVKSKNERKTWVKLIKEHCNKLREQNEIILEGIMEKKGKIHKAWQERYFVLKNKKLCYCKLENRHKMNKHEIDLHDIELIDHIPIDVDKNKKYFQFHLKQKDRLWQIRVKTEDERTLWTDCIFEEWNKLQLTLVRYKQILSEITFKQNIKDYFISRTYTITNILDDSIHVMRYHNNIDFINKFELTECSKNICPCWKRFCSSKKNNDIKDLDYFQCHDEENCLQEIFDNIHCYIYHSVDRRLRHRALGRSKRKTKNNKPDILSASEFDYDTEWTDNNMIEQEQNDDDIEEEEEDEEDENDDSYRLEAEYQYIEHNRNDTEIGETPGKYTSFQSHAKQFVERYENYNIDKYECDGQEFPGEYQGGVQMRYHQHEAGHICFKHEIRRWINEELFHRILSKCKKTAQTEQATKHICCNTNNDFFYIRFGHHLGIEHVMALYIYCTYTDLCYEFRKTYRAEHGETDINVQNTHYQRFYWFGRFLYEAVEFFGSRTASEFKRENNQKIPIKIYIGVNQRIVLKSLIGEFYQPTSTTDDMDIAMTQFAVDRSGTDAKYGLVMEISNQFNAESIKNSTRSHWCPWISEYSNENEHLFYGYNNTILIKNIWIWNYSESKLKWGWRTLQFEMNAINYWCQITMGYAGDSDYNVIFDNNFTRSRCQQFLAKLCEYELDYFVEINASKSFDINGNNSNLTYIYDFGDNTKPLKTNESIIKHQYNEPGVYCITVTVIDKFGNKSIAKLTQRIINPLISSKNKNDDQEEKKNDDQKEEQDDYPYACLSCNIDEHDNIIFDASKSHDINKMECKKFEFDFDDNTRKQISTSSIIKHKYNTSGIYCVKVIVFDKNGLSSLAQLTLRIKHDIDKNKNTNMAPSIMISSFPTNCNPKANMKYVPIDGWRYIHQLFHHILITKTGTKQKERKESLFDVDFRGIQSQKILPKLGQYLFENPQDEPKNWRIAEDKIAALYPNLKQFINEKLEHVQIN